MIKKYLRILSPTIVCCCFFITTASARVCFLPDSKDCGQSEITNVVVTCESQGGYDSDIACTANKKPSLTCYQNNECYFRKCQYDSELECKNEVHTNKYNCKSEKIDEQTTCYYSTVKTCAEIDAEYKASYNKETQVVEDTIQDANGNNCYKTRTKYCSEISANYRVSCPSLGGEETGVFGKDGACLLCYTCADKGYTEIGSKNSNCWDCEKCPIGLTYKCSVKKDLATSDYKIVSSNSSILGTNAQRCLKKSCADKFLKTEKSCASGNRAFIPSTPEVKASDGVCGRCTLKTCKQQDLVAEADCDTTANTFTEAKSVTASDAPCGTCTTKNTPKYDTYTLYAKVKCAGPYEQIKKCDRTKCAWGNTSDRYSHPEECWYDSEKSVTNKYATVRMDESIWSWGHNANDIVCPVSYMIMSGTSDYDRYLGQPYSAGYVSSPAKCISSISLDEENVSFSEINSSNIETYSTEVKNIYDTLKTDEQLIEFTLQAEQLTSSNIKLAIKPLVSGNNEIYTFNNYKKLSDQRSMSMEASDALDQKGSYEYAFANSFDNKMIIGGRIIDINLDLDKESQYVGDLPTIYPVIRLKATTRQILDSDKYNGTQYCKPKETASYNGMFIYPYYRDIRFFRSGIGDCKPNYSECNKAIIHSVGASRNILTSFSLGGSSRMNKGDVYVYLKESSACVDKYYATASEWASKYGWDEQKKGISDCSSLQSFLAAQGSSNIQDNVFGAFSSLYCQTPLNVPFESGHVNGDGAIYIFEDGFDTNNVEFEEPYPELSQTECEKYGNLYCEYNGLIGMRKEDDTNEPHIYTNYKEVDIGCDKKCYKATINDCTEFDSRDFITWKIPEHVDEDDQSFAVPTQVSTEKNNAEACEESIDRKNYPKAKLIKSTDFAAGSGKCVICYFKQS